MEALERADISCALIGAMALAHHGIARTTHDADLLVAERRVLLDSVWVLARRVTTVDIRRGESGDPLLGMVRIGTARAQIPVDVVVPRGHWLSGVVNRAIESERMAEIDGRSIPLVTLHDLVLLKADAAGSVDHIDIELIFETWPDRTSSLIDYVNTRLSRLDPYSQRRWRLFLDRRG